MPKLVLSKDGQVVREHIVDNEDTIIGRNQECDIAIEDDAVSRQHLRIICILGDCFLEDMNSSNGTLVNNRLTKKCPLENGDTISIGKHQINYDAAQCQTASDDEFDKTRIQLIKKLGEPDQVPADQEQSSEVSSHTSSADNELPTTNDSEPDNTQTFKPKTNADLESDQQPEQPRETTQLRTKAENPKARIGSLRIVSGGQKGHNMALNKSVTGIDKAGQRVAAITRRDNGYFLVPLGDGTSGNIKVTVNGIEVKRKIYPLWSNDIIGLGKTDMEFLFEE
ncbi:MAG: FHA domain-containing protein [Gammaproteobacteria bacterium]|nr:FHA domain-containing protein [Gammaproteobacteria bacterium]